MRTGKLICPKRVVKFVLVLLAITICSAHVFAQPNTESPNRGASVGNAYSMGDFENINLSNGNLMLNFHLGALPAGRGKVGGGVTLTYNSKLWDMGNEQVWDYRDTQSINPYVNTTVIKPNLDGGWRLSAGGYSLQIEDRQDLYGGRLPECRYPNNGPPTPHWEEMTYRYKLKVVFPDGSSHEMIPYGQIDVKNDRYFNITIDGRLENCGNWPSYTSRPIYYSVDGTYLRLETTSFTDWVLYFPDGSKVNGGTTYDRNGNYVSGVTDQLGREVRVTYNNGDTLVTTDGVNGDDIVWTIKWKTINVSKTYQSCETSHSCPQEYFRRALNHGFMVVDKIIQPAQMGGGEYVFSYNGTDTNTYPTLSNGWGEVSGVTLPSGAQIHYDYVMDGEDGPGDMISTRDILKNYPDTKTLEYHQQYDGSSALTTEVWNYQISHTGGSVTGPDGGVTTIVIGDTDPVSPGYPPPWNSGLTLISIAPDGTKTENLWGQNHPLPCTSSWNCYNFSSPAAADGSKQYNPYIKTSFTSIKNSSGSYTLTAIKDFTYDKNGNVTEVKEYDWVAYSTIPRDGAGAVSGIPYGITPQRITKTDFYNDAPTASSTTYNDSDSYWVINGPRLLNLVKSTEVQDGSNSPKSRSEITYDYLNYASSNTVAGNPTLTKVWDSFKGGSSQAYSNPLTSTNSISTSVAYNSYGMPTVTTDPKGVETTITYGCIDGQTTCTSNLSNLYPTKVEIASNYSTLKRTTSSIYDFYTGIETTATDVDNDLSIVTDYDRFGRPTNVRTAAGTPLESWVRTEYDDDDRKIVIRADLETMGDGKKVSSQFFDELGRVRLTKILENPTQDPTNETDGIKVQTRYKAIGNCTFSSSPFCSFQLNSNPYRAATSSAASSEETMGWTMAERLNTGKHQVVKSFSGAALPQPFVSSNWNTSPTGTIDTETDANITTVYDQADKKRRSIINAFGELIRVDEPDSNDNLGLINSPTQSTSYTYDVHGNLLLVVQGSQNRSLSYSSVSKLISATFPEGGTISYKYDNNGNLTQKTDSRGVIKTNTYDALNRITQTSYANEPSGQSSTPTVDYTYDNKTSAKGILTKISSSISTTEYMEFDLLGKVTAQKQTTDGKDYITGYNYNLGGILTETTYPSTRKVKNILNGTGYLSVVKSRKSASSGYWDYANSLTYNPSGAVKSLQLGNGLWESMNFNSRLQATRIAVGAIPAATNRLNLEYAYGKWVNGTLDSEKNNGDIAQQGINVPASGNYSAFIATQKYYYDSLNRLEDSIETIAGNQNWRQKFSYDRYGNRNFDENNTSTLPKNCSNGAQPVLCSADRKLFNPSISTSINRIVLDQDGDTLPEYAYDSSGNNTANASGKSFVYDAEHKMTMVKNSNNGQMIEQFFYDGEGKRVKKIVPATGEITIFVYDVGSKLLGEYSTLPAQIPQVSFITSDTIGTPRINTDQNGSVRVRHDYTPFGEEISRAGYGGDENRKQWAGYERDAESALDFAEARFYSRTLARFNSSDPLITSANNADPQTWNRYSYALNNPLLIVDPSGMWNWSAALGGDMTDDELRSLQDRISLSGLPDAQSIVMSIEDILFQRQQFRDAMDMLDRMIQRASTFSQLGEFTNVLSDIRSGYGTENDGNGVIIAVKDPATNGDAFTKVENGKFIVAFSADSLLGNVNALFLSIVHEGTHLQHAIFWVQGGMKDNANTRLWKTEIDAYYQAARAAALGEAFTSIKNSYSVKSGGSNLTIWQSGWKQAQIDTAIKNHLKNLGLLNANDLSTSKGSVAAFPGGGTWH